MSTAGSHQVYIGVGSNIEPKTYIPQAIERLRQTYGKLQVSQAYESAAVGFDGPPFINLVVSFRTEQTPAAVVAQMHAIETDCGRLRDESLRSRTVDLDLLLYDAVVDSQQRIPRKDILEYAFVLKPLAELAPQALHPVKQISYAQLWQELGAQLQSLTPVNLS